MLDKFQKRPKRVLLPRQCLVVAEAVERRQLLSTGTGLTAQYFNNTDLTSLAIVQTDPQINFAWGNTAPATGVTPGHFPPAGKATSRLR